MDWCKLGLHCAKRAPLERFSDKVGGDRKKRVLQQCKASDNQE